MIWESNQESFTPSNEAYMNTFMMKPASTLEQVQEQLNEVKDRPHRSSQAENALLSAAPSSLPRTCTLSKPVLFSGQPDISQMGLGRFCVEFLEFPGNRDLRPLEGDFQEALKTFMSPGSVITTKAAWSFTDSEDAAMKYSNGIPLVVEPEPGAVVWDTTAYVTDLSTEDDKIEYLFSPGAKFTILQVQRDKLSLSQDLDVFEELPREEAVLDLGIEKCRERSRRIISGIIFFFLFLIMVMIRVYLPRAFQ
uniref:Uncharacterized protein n=1 Tax=Moniliophthora roreri TaxID=221103 RepID=A0A0W0EYG6_MONRR